MFNSVHWHEYGFSGVVDEIEGLGLTGNIVENMQVSPSAILPIAAAVYIVMILLAYFIGNISPSTMLAKSKGLDIKKEGSGNAGTTNALRVMGAKAGVITLVVDVLKGVLAVIVPQILAGEECAMYCAVAVIIGHVWPAVYKFKGGKGVATTFGAIMAINPILGLWTLAVVVVTVLITKRMSAGSVMGAACFPILCFFNEPKFFVMGIMLAAIVIIKHRANIVRLMNCEEPKLGFLDKDKKKEKTQQEQAADEDAVTAETSDPMQDVEWEPVMRLKQRKRHRPSRLEVPEKRYYEIGDRTNLRKRQVPKKN